MQTQDFVKRLEKFTAAKEDLRDAFVDQKFFKSFKEVLVVVREATVSTDSGVTARRLNGTVDIENYKPRGCTHSFKEGWNDVEDVACWGLIPITQEEFQRTALKYLMN